MNENHDGERAREALLGNPCAAEMSNSYSGARGGARLTNVSARPIRPANANQGLGPRHRYRGQRRRGPKAALVAFAGAAAFTACLLAMVAPDQHVAMTG